MIEGTATYAGGIDLLDQLIPDPTNGNRAALDIDAPPETVWAALEEVTLLDCRVTSALLAVRSVPAIIWRRGELQAALGRTRAPLLEEMASSRFTVLHQAHGRAVYLGIIGQFWLPAGGTDAAFDGFDGFVAFDEPGYVKSVVGFAVEPTTRGSRLVTETRNHATDAAAARSFRVYWALIGWASKLTRIDIIHAVRRRAMARRDSGPTC